MAIVLQRPDTARGRPSSLLKKDEDYLKVYNPQYPIQLYLVCAEIMRRVEAYLKSQSAGLASKDRNNPRFYVAMYVAISLVGKPNPPISVLAKFDLTKLDDVAVKTSFDLVKSEYESLGGTDQVAKGPSLLEALRQHL